MLSVELGLSVAVIEIIAGIVVGNTLHCPRPGSVSWSCRRRSSPMWLGDKAASQAVLPAFLLGLAVSRTFERHRTTQQRVRVVALPC
jgi:Kef-type K+ transport system membrane component KefB